MAKFIWDELGMELEQDPMPAAERAENDAAAGWIREPATAEGVVVLRTDRHFALECEAASHHEAHEKFLTIREYREAIAE